jgi:hypothetical protein
LLQGIPFSIDLEFKDINIIVIPHRV